MDRGLILHYSSASVVSEMGSFSFSHMHNWRVVSVNQRWSFFLFIFFLIFFQLLDQEWSCLLRDLCRLLRNHVSDEHCHVYCGDGANLWEEWEKNQPEPEGRDLEEPPQRGQPDLPPGHDMGLCLFCLGSLNSSFPVPLLNFQFIAR